MFGARAGDAIAADAASGSWPGFAVHDAPVSAGIHPAGSATAAHEAHASTVPGFTRRALQELMWEHVGLVRDEEGLGHAASVIAHWLAKPRTPVAEHGYEDENLLLVAAEVVAAARARRQSVGAHFRTDDPATRTPQDLHATRPAHVLRAAPAAALRSSGRAAKEAVAC